MLNGHNRKAEIWPYRLEEIIWGSNYVAPAFLGDLSVLWLKPYEALILGFKRPDGFVY